jgi:hypothetical protein
MQGWGIPAGAVETPTSIPVESTGAIKSAAAWKDTPKHGAETWNFLRHWSLLANHPKRVGSST